MALKVGELYEELVVRDNTGPALASAEGNFNKTAGKISGIGEALRSGALAGMSAAVSDFGMRSFEASNTFRAGMANIASLIPGNTARVKELTNTVQNMQVQYGKSNQELTAGLYQTMSAFGDTADTTKIMEINLRAAAAGASTLASAVDLTGAVTKAYGDTSAKAVQQVSDLATKTVALGSTNFPQLAAAIGQATPLTSNLGVSQQELFAVMATGAKVTGEVSQVATQLSGVMQALMAPTEDMSGLMQSLGYENGQAMVKGLGLHGTIAAISTAAEESGKPLQAYIGSIEGQRLAVTLAGPQAQAYAENLKELGNAAGATEAAFKAQTEGVNKAGFMYEQVKQVWAVFMQTVGQVGPIFAAAGAISTVVQTVGTLKALTAISTVTTAANTLATAGNTVATGANTVARGANATANTVQAGAVGASTAALAANTVAASGNIGVMGRLAAMAGSVGTAITGAVGALGGLAMTAAWGGVVAGIATVLAELGGIWYYTDKAKKEMEKGKALDAKNLPKIAAINSSAQAHAAQAREMGYGSMTALQGKVKAGDAKATADYNKIMGKGGAASAPAETATGSKVAKISDKQAKAAQKDAAETAHLQQRMDYDRQSEQIELDTERERLRRAMAEYTAATDPEDRMRAAANVNRLAEEVRYREARMQTAAAWQSQILAASDAERSAIENNYRLAEKRLSAQHELTMENIRAEKAARVDTDRVSQLTQPKSVMSPVDLYTPRPQDVAGASSATMPTVAAAQSQPWVNQAYIDQQRLAGAGLQGVRAVMPFAGIPMPAAPTPPAPVIIVQSAPVQVQVAPGQMFDAKVTSLASKEVSRMVATAPGVR